MVGLVKVLLHHHRMFSFNSCLESSEVQTSSVHLFIYSRCHLYAIFCLTTSLFLSGHLINTLLHYLLRLERSFSRAMQFPQERLHNVEMSVTKFEHLIVYCLVVASFGYHALLNNFNNFHEQADWVFARCHQAIHIIRSIGNLIWHPNMHQKKGNKGCCRVNTRQSLRICWPQLDG